MLASQRPQLFPAAAILIAAVILVAIVVIYQKVETSNAAVKAPAAAVNTATAKPSNVQRTPSAAPRLIPVQPAAPKLATPLDMPQVHGGFLVSFSKPERRQNEDERNWGYRVQFLDQYQRFLVEAKIGPAQENALRAILADAQMALDASRRAPYPEDMDTDQEVSLKIEAEGNIQESLSRRLNQVLNSRQQALLKNPEFLLIRTINALGFEPLEIEKRQ